MIEPLMNMNNDENGGEGGGNGMMNATSSSSMMSNYFTPWNEYQLTLLFATWQINSMRDYVGAWFAVCFATMFYHYLDCVILGIEKGMKTFLSKDKTIEEEGEEGDLLHLQAVHENRESGRRRGGGGGGRGEDREEKKTSRSYPLSAIISQRRPKRPVGWFLVKMIHGLLVAVKYALGLMLMLVAMTFNPGLFVALFVGYWAGDFFFCDSRLDLDMFPIVIATPSGHSVAFAQTTSSFWNIVNPMYEHWAIRMIRWSLCIPFHQMQFARAELYKEEEPPLQQQIESSTTSLRNPVSLIPSSWSWKVGTEMMKALPRVISLIYLVVLLVWIVNVEGGFGWNEDSVFGWHALLMSFFIVVFTNEALLTYKAPLLPQLANHRLLLRSYHVICHVGSITCIIIGLIAIIDYKKWFGPTVVYPFYVMYSPHSWLGVMTIAFFGIQFLFGLILFSFITWKMDDEREQRLKAQFVEIHHFLGYVMYGVGLATCITGFQDMQSSDIASAEAPEIMNPDYEPNGHDDAMGDSGYGANSVDAQLSAAGAILLIALGISTLAVIRFLPKVETPMIEGSNKLIQSSRILSPMKVEEVVDEERDPPQVEMNNVQLNRNYPME